MIWNTTKSLASVFALTIIACLPWAQSTRAQGTSYTSRERKDRALYLCDWRRTHGELMEPNPVWMDFCDDPKFDKPSFVWDAEVRDWWGVWIKRRGADAVAALQADFDADWLANRAPEVREAEKQEERAAEADLERREKAEAAAAKHQSLKDLCLAVWDHGSQAARHELERRRTFTAVEWELIDSHEVKVGMSEAGLYCSWGKARANRTVTGGVEEKQYVYDSAYVYVTNGRVTGFQDQQ